MTEDEAKTKWCPFVRVVPPTSNWHGMNNRAQLVKDGSNLMVNCLASSCMAWRWAMVDEGRSSSYQSRDRGGCGLAGAPQ